MKRGDLKAIAEDANTPMIDLLVLSVIKSALEFGDAAKLEYLLRRIGIEPPRPEPILISESNVKISDDKKKLIEERIKERLKKKK